MQETKALIVSPHPDDLEIGMGGTACLLLEKGVEVVSVIVTDGRRSANPLGISQEELVQTRELEVRTSSEILGVEVSLLGFSDMESDSNKREFSSRMAKIITNLRPGEIYLPHPEIDKHRTHRTVSRLTLGCLDAALGESPFECECWFYEVWTPFPSYDRIEDITSFADRKRQAIEAHMSQTSYKDYTDGIMGLNRYRGAFHDTADGFAPLWAEVFIKHDSG
ncbi:MAG: PIG-L family deacetylase [Candidatus Dadabacteria bacterium]|nr:PIG-L family deacetylase [Candidatus Dadabacteria bacterium]MDE0663638.1 PIG-L family deacetylase [Candidatus Dadabacteria bacterium]